MFNYSWSIEYIRKMTKGQIILFNEKINKRTKRENDFQISLHGGEPKNQGLNLNNAIPIEYAIENKMKHKESI